MFGLMYLIFIGVYLLISLTVVFLVVGWAGRRERNRLLWGGVAALLMYNLVFWDWIPTVLAHKNYCENEAGLWIYKTLDQWKEENPGVMETLQTQRVWPSQRDGDIGNYSTTLTVNQRFNYLHKKNGPYLLNVWRHEQEIIDVSNGNVLARQIDFSSGNGNVGGEPELKLWIHKNNCTGGRDRAIQFVKYLNQFKGIEK